MFTEALKRAEAVIPALSEKDRKILDAGTKINAEEHHQMQNLQALAFANDKITMEVSMFLHNTLGGTNTVFNKQKLVKRYIVLKIIKEIAAIN